MRGSNPLVPWSHRLAALIVVLSAIAFVWVLAGLDPDARGHGSHEALGMPRCSWPEHYGIPCPTCGCTTAAIHVVHLSPWRALVTQPFGAVLAMLGLALAVFAGVSLVRGTSFVERVAMWPYGTATVWLIGLLLAAWGYKYLTWTG